MPHLMLCFLHPVSTIPQWYDFLMVFSYHCTLMPPPYCYYLLKTKMIVFSTVPLYKESKVKFTLLIMPCLNPGVPQLPTQGMCAVATRFCYVLTVIVPVRLWVFHILGLFPHGFSFSFPMNP